MVEIGNNLAEIRRQHRGLILLIQECLAALRNRADRPHLIHWLEQLVVKTRQHFDAEERYMALKTVTHGEEHIRMHKRIIGELRNLICLDESSSLEAVVTCTLSELLTHHLQEDADLAGPRATHSQASQDENVAPR
jgi:hemerythrin-like metal-binding protein